MPARLIFILSAIVVLAGCVSADPAKERNAKASAINVQLGIGYLRQNNLELANEKLNKALTFNPESAPAHNAYAMLQERLLQTEKAEFHYKKATELDPKDSQSANNFGAFLCKNQREAESEKYFVQALKNPLYKTPEYAYTNAALCLLRIDEKSRAVDYLSKALAARSDFPTALIAMSDVQFDAGNYEVTRAYLERYHRVQEPTAKSLWLDIRAALQINQDADVDAIASQLEQEFPASEEFKSWLEIQ